MRQIIADARRARPGRGGIVGEGLGDEVALITNGVFSVAPRGHMIRHVSPEVAGRTDRCGAGP